MLAACGGNQPPPPTTVGPGTPASPGARHQPPGVTAIEDENGTTFQIAQGAPGAPEVVGCADGQREAFVDAAAFPTIAGCIGEWSA